MCGRFTLRAPAEAIRGLLPLFELPQTPSMPPRFNIAPTQDVAVVRQQPHSHRPEMVMMRWGLIPTWADDPRVGCRTINARAETAATRPAFRAAFQARRCLVLADGFYEWQKRDGAKQPHYLQLRDGKPFAFAGLWEHWDRSEQPIDSCTILTTDANELVRPLHDRMPVILDRRDLTRWLGGGAEQGGAADQDELRDLLRPYPSNAMTAYPVSSIVNSPRNDVPECLARVTPVESTSLFPQEEGKPPAARKRRRR